MPADFLPPDLPPDLPPGSASAEAGSNAPPFLSITELSQLLKRTVESNFDFVRVRAEISRPTRAASGHLYFTLKDEKNTLDAVCWKTVAGSLGVQPEEGLEVVVTGKLTIYGGRSKYQIVVQTMEMAGGVPQAVAASPPRQLFPWSARRSGISSGRHRWSACR